MMLETAFEERDAAGRAGAATGNINMQERSR